MKHMLVLWVVTGLLGSASLAHADAGMGAGAGMLGGALVGSLSGPSKSRPGNTLIGAVVGGLMGYAIGNEAEKQGRVVVNQALEVGPSYTTSSWVNPETDVAYVVTPQPARVVEGRVCREVDIKASIDAKRETLSGLTCRDEYGQWRLVDRTAHSVAPVRVVPTQTVVVQRPVVRYVVAEPEVTYYPSSASSVYIYNGWSRRHHRHGHRDYDWGGSHRRGGHHQERDHRGHRGGDWRY